MLLGCFAASGPGTHVKINGFSNSTKYQDILTKNLVASALDLPTRQWPQTYFKINTEMVLWKQNQYFAKAISVSGLKPSQKYWVEEGSP